MPDEPIVTQDFDLLRKPLSNFAKQIEQSGVLVSKFNKNITKVTDIDWKKIEDVLDQVNNTTTPAPLQSIPVKRSTNNSSPIATAVSPPTDTVEPPKSDPQKTNSKVPNRQNNTTNNIYTGYGAFGR